MKIKLELKISHKYFRNYLHQPKMNSISPVLLFFGVVSCLISAEIEGATLSQLEALLPENITGLNLELFEP